MLRGYNPHIIRMDEMICKNAFCLHQKDGECTINTISVNEYGMCNCYEMALVSDQLLLRIKTMQKKYGEVLKTAEDNYVEVSKLASKKPHSKE